MRCNVIDFEMRTNNDSTYEDHFCHNESDAKGTLEFLGERMYIEVDVTQKDAGSYIGGTIYFSSGEYTGDVMMDFMFNTAVNIYKGDDVIFRHYDRHWRFPDDGLDDVTPDYTIPNPAIEWIKETMGASFALLFPLPMIIAKNTPMCVEKFTTLAMILNAVIWDTASINK